MNNKKTISGYNIIFFQFLDYLIHLIPPFSSKTHNLTSQPNLGNQLRFFQCLCCVWLQRKENENVTLEFHYLLISLYICLLLRKKIIISDYYYNFMIQFFFFFIYKW